MEYVLLGLLMQRVRTLYELNKLLEERIGLFYRASFGSISAALTNLLAKEWISMTAVVERGRNKKQYTITEAGRLAFQEWLQSPIPAEQVKDPALLRLFFLGYLPPEQRIAMLEQHLATLTTLHASLERLAQEARVQAVPEPLQEIVAFQTQTLTYGLDYYAFSKDWFRNLLETLSAGS